MESETVGVIGLGTMGSAISNNLLGAGLGVIGFDIDEQRCQELRRNGGLIADSPLGVAQKTNVIITSLPNDGVLGLITEGDNNLCESGNDQLVVIETSTLTLQAKFRARDILASWGISLLDCPLSGTGAQALVKDLVVYVSGSEEIAEPLGELFDAFARRHVFTGEFGNGTKLKYIANLLVAIHNVSTAEAISLAKHSGIDLDIMYEVIGDGAGNSKMFEIRGPLMIEQVYEPATMRVDMFSKDIGIISDFVEQQGSNAPLFSVAASLYQRAMQDGRNSQDTACVLEVLEESKSISE